MNWRVGLDHHGPQTGEYEAACNVTGDRRKMLVEAVSAFVGIPVYEPAEFLRLLASESENNDE